MDTNNVAAQAGNEPITLHQSLTVGAPDFELLVKKLQEAAWHAGNDDSQDWDYAGREFSDALVAAYNSAIAPPRATADVEREKDADRFAFVMRVADNPDGAEAMAIAAIGNEQMETDRPESVQMRELIDAAIATTKPGA